MSRIKGGRRIGKGFARAAFVSLIPAVVLLAGCDGGSPRDSNVGVDPAAIGISCDGSCAGADSFLTADEVGQVIARAVAEAQAQGAPATVAVVDRVGNVLGVFRMNGAGTLVGIDSGTGAAGGLEGVDIVPDGAAAIAKALTAAYLSTEGNAFSTRTANQIVQKHFAPGERDQPSGPLFGVQFSQLACSDVVQRFDGATTEAGPKRSPLGLAADPGGFPLYKGGTLVGGVGVIADGVYGIDEDVADFDRDVDELIAYAATFGLAAPPQRRAHAISVAGKLLRFSDAGFGDLASEPETAPPFASIDGVEGALLPVAGYYEGTALLPGVPFGQPASGVRPDALDFPGLDAFVLVDRNDVERFRPSDGTDQPAGSAANALTAAEVRELLARALAVANAARAQIRRPLGSPARVTVSVVDTSGAVLGVVRSRDAPVFGFDVSVQKARTAAFFSGTGTAGAPGPLLRALPDPAYFAAPGLATPIGDYVAALQAFLDDTGALEPAGLPLAMSDRAGGNLARPHFPDGPVAGPPGPFSKPAGEWSVFSTGLQLDLAYNAIVHHVAFLAGAAGTDVAQNCTGSADLSGGFAAVSPIPAIANGIQIFPGSVPVYRGDVLVGGIGVSGDGVDQDDLVAFLGLARASDALGAGIGNAPKDIRADRLTPQGVRLRYVSCPQAPFNGSDEQNVCEGL